VVFTNIYNYILLFISQIYLKGLLQVISFNKYNNCTRGSILGGGIFIEIIEKLDYNHIYLSCGS